jgi:chromosome segregation ATPase
MTDDIVARLRMYANAFIDDGWATVVRSDLNNAADEIERLRRDYSAAEKDHCDYVKKYNNAKVEIERLRKELKGAR